MKTTPTLKKNPQETEKANSQRLNQKAEEQSVTTDDELEVLVNKDSDGINLFKAKKNTLRGTNSNVTFTVFL